MIPADCIPLHANETVLALFEGPNRYGRYTFFLR
jgi:hypothetical protein